MSEDSAICARCNTEIKAEEARWTGLEPAEYWHYGCADEAGVTKPDPAHNKHEQPQRAARNT